MYFSLLIFQLIGLVFICLNFSDILTIEFLCLGFEDKIKWFRDENWIYPSLFPGYLKDLFCFVLFHLLFFFLC